MAKKGGYREGAGRKVGSINKISRSFKELVQNTFESLENEKDGGMLDWARKNKTDFYKIASKLIPADISVKAQVTQLQINKTIIKKNV